jgi:eukaryotic-like serine/threonine-protein kinase
VVAAATSSPLQPGAVLAPGYFVVAHLRRGDALDVYDVWSTDRACRCVAKVVAPARTDRRAPARLIREGEILLSLAHPHIVRAYELLDGPLLILETLTGQTLANLVAEDGPLTAVEAAYLGQHLCSALGYLHRLGWLHLDLTPGNVIAVGGVAKLLDLSLAREPGPVPAGLGTRGYRAPEQERGGEASATTDVWGLGAVLMHALGGDLEDAPAAMAAALEACLAPGPGDRPGVAELAAVLAGVADPLEELAA